MTEMKIFVYGSFTEGFVHFSKIQEFVKSSLPAQIKGSAYRLKVGYPVLIEAGQDSISGQLLSLESSSILLNLLDTFHGYNSFEPEKSLYLRKEIQVETSQGAEAAWIYFLNPKKLPKDAVLIENGNWQGSLKDSPPLSLELTERQKTYIQKLGAASGREIVPINDLGLYRELMNLELIVDKGRRLALSKFGHEVNRFLE